MLEIEFLEQNKTHVTTVYKFIGRLVSGLFIAFILGGYLDKLLNVEPLFMIALIIYVIFGSLYLLVKELK